MYASESWEDEFARLRRIVDRRHVDGVILAGTHSYLYNKVVFDVLREVRGDGEAVVFARSGTVGSQQLRVHWGGDCSATYESMAETLRGGLSLGLSGFGYVSPDAEKRHSMAGGEPNVFFASDTRDKKHAPLGGAKRLRRGFHVLFVGGGRHSSSRLRSIQAEAVANFDPAKTDALEGGGNRRRIRRRELEVDEVRPIPQRYFKNVGNWFECNHAITAIRLPG